MVMASDEAEMNAAICRPIRIRTGKALFVDFFNVVKKDGAGFVPYEWPKAGFNLPQPKLSYVVGFCSWSWVIGTGVYIDDLDAQTRASTQRSPDCGRAESWCSRSQVDVRRRGITGALQAA